MRNNKKGFTLLELVIVILIAVIIFTSTLITGINLKKEAKINPDSALVHTVNAMIKSSDMKVDGIEDVITLMTTNGYSETSFRAKIKDEHFGYDITNKRIFLVNNAGEVICADSKVDTENSYVVVFDENDLVTNANLYLLNDIEVTKDIVMINDHSIDLNGKTITSANRIYFQGVTPNVTVISNGTIDAKEIFFDEKGSTIHFGRGTTVVVDILKSKSSVTLADNAHMDIIGAIELYDDIEFRVSGDHTINLPAKISFAPTIKIAKTMTENAYLIYNEAEFVNIIAGEYNEKLYIDSVSDFIVSGDYYTLEPGYYFLNSDITLNKPLKIAEGDNVTINYGRKELKFSTENGIINYGDLRLAGESTSKYSATISALRYAIKNYGKLEVDNVNIVSVGNRQDGTYNGNTTIAIENLATNNVINIVKSTITASIGIDSKSKCDINLKEVKIIATRYSVYALSGNINIGAVSGSKIDFSSKCFFGSTGIKVVIGTPSSTDSLISMNGYDYNGDSANFVDYTKKH